MATGEVGASKVMVVVLVSPFKTTFQTSMYKDMRLSIF